MNPPDFAEALGRAGLTLLFLLPASVALRGLVRWPAALALLAVAALVNWPMPQLSAVSYLRSLLGDLSITSVVLLAQALGRRYGLWAPALAPALARDRLVLFGAIVLGALVLYPAAMSIGAADPFRWGFASPSLLAALLAVALVGWRLGSPTLAACIALAVLAWSLRLNASTNLWTYLIDPLLGVYAAGALLAAGVRQLRPHWSWQSTALLLTAVIWLFPGLLNREPWKADEAYSFGVVYSIVDAGQWLVPTLAGEPFVEKPPFMFWLAAIWTRLPLAGFSTHELARFANVSVVLASLLLVAWTARLAGMSRAAATAAVALLAGTPVFLVFTRYLTADLGLFPAAALVSLGFVALVQGRAWAGAALGAGVAIGFLSKGLLLPAATGLAGLALIGLSGAARNAYAVRQYLLAAGVFVVLGLAWPLALWLEHPQQFRVWLWDNNFGRFFGDNGLGPPNQRLQIAGTIVLLLLPAWPFALATLWRLGRSWRASPLLGPALFAAAWLMLLMVSSTARGAYALPVIVPIAVLGAPALERLTRRDWPRLRVALWIVAAVAVAALLAYSISQAARAGAAQPWTRGVMPLTLVLAGLTAFAWFMTRRAGQRVSIATHWVACQAIVFAVAIALILPGADARTGFSSLFREAAARLNPDRGCIASIGLGESERGMLHYFAGIHTRRLEAAPQAAGLCPQWLEQQRVVDDASRFGCRGGRELWSGNRPGNTFDRFRVCERTP